MRCRHVNVEYVASTTSLEPAGCRTKISLRRLTRNGNLVPALMQSTACPHHTIQEAAADFDLAAAHSLTSAGSSSMIVFIALRGSIMVERFRMARGGQQSRGEGG